MSKLVLLLAAIALCFMLGGCGSSDNQCRINAAVTPATAMADHTLPPPENQVQFVARYTATGLCPSVPDITGTFSTSDPINTSVTNQDAVTGIATCLNATPAPATISYSGRVRGAVPYTPATLSCK